MRDTKNDRHNYFSACAEVFSMILVMTTDEKMTARYGLLMAKLGEIGREEYDEDCRILFQDLRVLCEDLNVPECTKEMTLAMLSQWIDGRTGR